jgi:hypothetical protein
MKTSGSSFGFLEEFAAEPELVVLGFLFFEPSAAAAAEAAAAATAAAASFFFEADAAAEGGLRRLDEGFPLLIGAVEAAEETPADTLAEGTFLGSATDKARVTEDSSETNNAAAYVAFSSRMAWPQVSPPRSQHSAKMKWQLLLQQMLRPAALVWGLFLWLARFWQLLGQHSEIGSVRLKPIDWSDEWEKNNNETTTNLGMMTGFCDSIPPARNY